MANWTPVQEAPCADIGVPWAELVLTRGGERRHPLPMNLRLREVAVEGDGAALIVQGITGMHRCTWRVDLERGTADLQDAVDLSALRSRYGDVRAGNRSASSGTCPRRAVLEVPRGPGTLHALVSLPSQRLDSSPPPLVIDVHGGPWPGLDLDDATRRAAPWLEAGFAHLAVEYRASGALGRGPMEHVLRGADVPGPGDDASDVLAAWETLRRQPWAQEVDSDRAVLFGFSYGAYVVNRIVTHPSAFPRWGLAICHEGVADLRGLDQASMDMQVVRRGSTPGADPGHWSAASPVDAVQEVSTPMLLVYGGRSPVLAQGEAWRDALRRAGTEIDWHVAPGEGHVFAGEAAADIPRRARDLLGAWSDPRALPP
ncbi:alpha/beta hydrolase family protein [Brachybacterium hainanense]|uniref:Alpha/beta hydrolase family protein n=1 Tax=Brachybacterium hainanense TaxID=1541174 RepID=A0ABV6RDL5_9MICO